MQAEPSKPATIGDVARVSRVSPATVSRALNGHPRVDPELVRRVEAAAQQVNYRPNSAGRALRRQRADLLAAIVPDVRNPFFVGVIEAFEQSANAAGYSVMLCNSHEETAVEKASIESVIAHQASGVLIAAASPHLSRLAPLQRAGIPVITVDRQVNDFWGDSVSVDNPLIGQLAARHLLEQGRTRPLVLNHSLGVSPMRDREVGFLAEMAAAGHPVAPERILQLPFQADVPLDVSELLSGQADCDAVFATTNSLTGAAFIALRALGRRIGPDIGLIGVDDDRWNSMVEPQVTVVEQPSGQLGAWAGQLLAARASGARVESARILLNPVLRVRASSLRQGAD
ncbi:MAG: LacI family DNA-binding transcriptional regulator [Propionicimonas sp.]